jgi:hypothetical protein
LRPAALVEIVIRKDYENSSRTVGWAWFKIDRAEIDSCWCGREVSESALSWFWSVRTHARIARPMAVMPAVVFRGLDSTSGSGRPTVKMKAAGLAPRRSGRNRDPGGLREQFEHRLLGLVRDRQS